MGRELKRVPLIKMGRELKRVPLNFDYPLNQVWYGYFLRPSTCMSGVMENIVKAVKSLLR